MPRRHEHGCKRYLCSEQLSRKRPIFAPAFGEVPQLRPVRTKANGARPTRPRWPGGSAAAVLRMRCPICLDEVPLTVLAGCSHAACQGGGGDSHEH